MRFRYRVRRPYKPRGKYFFSDRDIDFTGDSFPYEQFLLQEFFNADVDTLSRFRSAYIERYGERAFDYLYRKYHEWREGHYHLTELMQERILDMMPKFLSAQARLDIGLFEFSRAIKGIVQDHERNRLRVNVAKGKVISIDEWANLVEKEHGTIEALDTWPHRYHPLPEAESQDALAVAQYILHLKLNESAARVCRDIDVMRPRLAQLNAHGCASTYRLHDFGMNIDLSSIGEVARPESLLEERSLPEESRYQAYAEKYFAYELTKVHLRGKGAQGNAITFGADISQLIQRLDEFALGVNIVSVKQSLAGEGGVLDVEVKIHPIKLAKSMLFRSQLYLAALASGVFLGVLLAVKVGVGDFVLTFGLLGLLWVLAAVTDHIQKIKRARRIIQEHEYRKPTG